VEVDVAGFGSLHVNPVVMGAGVTIDVIMFVIVVTHSSYKIHHHPLVCFLLGKFSLRAFHIQ